MAIVADRYTYVMLVLPRWNVEIPAAREGNTLFFPIDYLCEDVLRVDKRGQVRVIRGDSRMTSEEVVREIPFKLNGGWRMHLSIRKPECALWIGGIDPARCGLSAQGNVKDFQADLSREAERLLFNAIPRIPEGQRGALGYNSHEEVRIACLDCGSPHRIVIENGEVVAVLRDSEE